jgi:hypothetical protein
MGVEYSNQKPEDQIDSVRDDKKELYKIMRWSKPNTEPDDFEKVALSLGVEELKEIGPELSETQNKKVQQAVETAELGNIANARALLLEVVKTVTDANIKARIEYVVNCYFEND